MLRIITHVKKLNNWHLYTSIIELFGKVFFLPLIVTILKGFIWNVTTIHV
jgi:hypothetical protein